MWMVPPSSTSSSRGRSSSSQKKSPSFSASSSATWSGSTAGGVAGEGDGSSPSLGPPRLPVPVIYLPQFEALPQPVMLEIFKRCDPVSIARTSRVCASLRTAIHSEMDRPTPSIEPSQAFARLFIPDRRRMILERFIMEDDSRPRRTRLVSSDGVSSSSPPSSSALSRPSAPERETSERSLSYCTVRSISSELSINDFLDTVYEKPLPTMAEKLRPRATKYETDQMVQTAEPAWAYTFDLKEWLREYDITEVCLQNFANFLEREGGQMADVPSTSSGFNLQPQPQPTPPWNNNGAADGSAGVSGMSGGVPPTRLLGRSDTKATIYDTLTQECVGEDVKLSSGRLERLASKLAPINPLHLIFRDHSLYMKRPVHLIFWFISQLRPNLRRITLDGVQSKDRVRLEGVLPLNNIEQLNIRQANTNPALIANEEILLSWLRLPSAERSKIRVRFQNCRRLSPKGMCRFIREWQMYPEVAEFDTIIVDEDSMHPWELVEEAEKDVMNYEKQEYYLRARQTDLPAYATSKKEFLSEEQAESLKRSMEFVHSKGGRAIKYYYEDGLLLFSLCNPSHPRLHLRPRSPPSPSSLLSSPSTPSSSHLLIGCSSHRSSIPSRPGSLPRDHTANSALFRSYHPPPPTPSMFGRILQILRSNA